MRILSQEAALVSPVGILIILVWQCTGNLSLAPEQNSWNRCDVSEYFSLGIYVILLSETCSKKRVE